MLQHRAMSEPTLAAMLENVRTAINDALVSGGAVEVEINGRRIKRDYNQLLAIEKRLLERQAAETGGTRAYAAFSQRPQ
jgi:hypothetical protein